MAKPQPPSPKETEQLAEQLADMIVEKTDPSADKTLRLVDAIIKKFGSLEAFYEQVYKLLTKEQIEKLGYLLDSAVTRKKKEKLNLASIINSKTFERIIQNFKSAGVGIPVQADHAAPLTPTHAGTSVSTTDKKRGR